MSFSPPEFPHAYPGPNARGRGERVMLIEDEPALCSVFTRLLSRLHYEVIAFTSPSEALCRFGQDPECADVVITDLSMPEMNGVEVALRLLSRRPELPVLLITGCERSWSEERVRQLGIRGILRKPVSCEELAEAVRRAVRGRSATLDS